MAAAGFRHDGAQPLETDDAVARIGLETAMKAIWNGTVIAESDRTVVLEGNHYFPLSALRREYFRLSDTHTTCFWKGVASYYDVVVGEDVNRDAAWFYPNPSQKAGRIKDHVAFWHGVRVVE